MTSDIGCYFGRWGRCSVVTETFYASLSQIWLCSYQYHCKEASLLFIVSRSMNNGLPHGLLWQHRPWPSTSPFVAAWTTEAIMVLRGSTSQRHQHDLQRQHRPWTSTWPSVVTRATDTTWSPGHSRITDTKMALSDYMDPWHQHGLWWNHRTCILTWPSNDHIARPSGSLFFSCSLWIWI